MRRNSKQEREHERADASRLMRAWKKFHRENREAVLTGPHATTLVELFRMFSAIEHVKPAQLIGFIGAIDWGSIDYQTRLTVLHEVNEAITKFRVKHGMEPIDDSLPGQPDTPFRTIKAIMFSPPNEGATRGAARPE